MTKTEFTQNDFDEVKVLAGAINMIDRMDEDYMNAVSDEIFALQPFFLSVLLGYSYDVSMVELEEIMKIYFLVWEYFRLKPNVRNKQVTESFFTKIQQKNIEMFKYSDGEPGENERSEIYSYDLQNIKSKSLLAAIFFRLNERTILVNMDTLKKGAVIIDVKSFIECFEKI